MLKSKILDRTYRHNFLMLMVSKNCMYNLNGRRYYGDRRNQRLLEMKENIFDFQGLKKSYTGYADITIEACLPKMKQSHSTIVDAIKDSNYDVDDMTYDHEFSDIREEHH